MLTSSLAVSTSLNYSHHIKVFLAFCNTQSLPIVFPFDQYLIMTFLLKLHHDGKKHSTLMTYVSAIAFAHKVRGFADPTSTFLFGKFMTGLKKLSANTTARLQPITINMLTELIILVESLSVSEFEKMLLKAIMSVMYHACLRISEVGRSGKANHALASRNVSFITKPPSLHPRKMRITLTSFKHSKGPQTLEINGAKDKRVCPVRLLYLFKSMKNHSSRTFFCHEGGQPITRTYMMSRLRELVALSSFSHKRLNTHSFRIGRTTDLVLKGGVSDAYIRHVGRWSSNAYLKYVRSIVSL